MKKMGMFLAGLIFLTCGISACNDKQGYEKYDDAELYSVGNAVFSVAEVKKVDIDWLGGSVEIAQSEDKVTIAEEQSQNAEERMRYYLDGEVLKVKYCQSGLRSRVKTQSKHLLLTLPQGVGVHIDGEKVDVTVGNLQTTEFDMESVEGNLTAERISCDHIEVETIRGKITIGELITREASLDTETGDVAVEKLSADLLESESKSGNLSFGLQKATQTKEEIETTSGNVKIKLWNGLSANIRFISPSGSLQTSKTYQKQDGKYLFAGEGGNCNLTVKTFSGNLVVE